jgi:tRNA threonylcarbamoyl adenosine modification protein YeaZ
MKFQYALALHTSSPELGLAISNFTGTSRCQTWELGRDLSLQLHPYLQAFIQPQTWQEISWIAVAKGPGSFTGTRIGMVTARTLAQALNVPVYAISTLASLARMQILENSAIPENVDLAVQMSAQRGQIFVAIYKSHESGTLTTLLPDTTLTLEQWQQTLTEWPSPYYLIEAETNLGASVASVLELADLEWQQGRYPHWSEALPFYGQHPIEDKKL